MAVLHRTSCQSNRNIEIRGKWGQCNFFASRALKGESGCQTRPPSVAHRARLLFAGVPQHIIQRGNNRQATFFAEEDYRSYLDWLLEAGKKYDCRIYAYVLRAQGQTRFSRHCDTRSAASYPSTLNRSSSRVQVCSGRKLGATSDRS